MRNLIAIVCLLLVSGFSAFEHGQGADVSQLSVQQLDALAKEFAAQDEVLDPFTSLLEAERAEVLTIYKKAFKDEALAISMIEAATAPLGFGAAPSLANNTIPVVNVTKANTIDLVKQTATETATKVAQDQIRVNAPELYKRLLKSDEYAKIHTEAKNNALYDIPRTAIDGLTPLQALQLVKKAGKNAAVLVAQKAGLSAATEKGQANAKISIATARKIIADAVDAAVKESLAKIELPADEPPKAATISGSAFLELEDEMYMDMDMDMDMDAEAEVDMDAEVEVDMDAEEEVEEEDAPAPAPAAPVAANTTAPAAPVAANTTTPVAPVATNATAPVAPVVANTTTPVAPVNTTQAVPARKPVRAPVPKSAPGGQASHYGPENMVYDQGFTPNVPAPSSTNQLGFPNTPISEDERQLNLNKWKNFAVAAPFTQMLWKQMVDGQNNKYYINTITNEITWRALSAADLAKKANDFATEDAPQLVAFWNGFVVSLDGGNVKKPRDFCNPNLCLNGRPCINGKCQCGDKFQGDLCEIINPTPITLQWKPSLIQATLEEDYERKLAALRTFKRDKDLATRNKTTDFFGPIYAEASLDDIMTQSVLNDQGLVDPKIKIKGPHSTRMGGFMPDTVAFANKAMEFYNKDKEALLVQPKALKKINKLNDLIQIQRVKLHDFVQKTVNDPAPVVSPVLKETYGIPPVVVNPAIVRAENFLAKEPGADYEPTFGITSKSNVL